MALLPIVLPNTVLPANPATSQWHTLLTTYRLAPPQQATAAATTMDVMNAEGWVRLNDAAWQARLAAPAVGTFMRDLNQLILSTRPPDPAVAEPSVARRGVYVPGRFRNFLIHAVPGLMGIAPPAVSAPPSPLSDLLPPISGSGAVPLVPRRASVINRPIAPYIGPPVAPWLAAEPQDARAEWWWEFMHQDVNTALDYLRLPRYYSSLEPFTLRRWNVYFTLPLSPETSSRLCRFLNGIRANLFRQAGLPTEGLPDVPCDTWLQRLVFEHAGPTEPQQSQYETLEGSELLAGISSESEEEEQQQPWAPSAIGSEGSIAAYWS